LDNLVQKGVDFSVIGKLIDKEGGLEMVIDGKLLGIPFFEIDEITMDTIYVKWMVYN
jgi:hypothetical protein